jgi:hypothetical protein
MAARYISASVGKIPKGFRRKAQGCDGSPLGFSDNTPTRPRFLRTAQKLIGAYRARKSCSIRCAV